MSEEEYRKAVSEAPVEWDDLMEKKQQAKREREIRQKNQKQLEELGYK